MKNFFFAACVLGLMAFQPNHLTAQQTKGGPPANRGQMKKQNQTGYQHLGAGQNWQAFDGKQVSIDIVPDPEVGMMQHPMNSGFNPMTNERQEVLYAYSHPKEKGRMILVYYYASSVKFNPNKKKLRAYGTLRAVGSPDSDAKTKGGYRGYYLSADRIE